VETSKTIEAIVEATKELIDRRWGALIVIQRETGLRMYKEAGNPLKAEVTSPLLISIFNPTSPLHDGAVIIQNDIIEAASCILPLTESAMIDPSMGTRHRAALGLSEETDAIIIIVSEETQRTSVAENGRLAHIGMDEMALRRYLNDRLFISSGD
jgi:diadenylate cyclase